MESKGKFNLSVKTGVAQSGFTMYWNTQQKINTFEFNTQNSIRFGIEGQYTLPLNRNKWAFVFEPTYQQYSDSQEFTYLETSLGSKTTDVIVEYKSVELPLGIRYYSFLSPNSKLFFNGFYIYDAPISSSIKAEREDLLSSKIRMDDNLAFGVGYKYKNKFSAEFRYQTPRDLSYTASINDSEYTSFGFIFGYTLF